MGFTNGLITKNSKSERGEKGDKGEGFKLTEDDHFHLENKRLTNVAPPVSDNDAVTKKYLTNSLKTKAATTYVINELAKKASTGVLENYVLKKDIPSGDALEDYALKTDLHNLASEVNDSLNNKTDKTETQNSLSLKLNLNDFNTYSDNIKNQMSTKANNSDLSNYYTKAQVENNFKTKSYITIWAEENGPIVSHSIQWSFGNGTENNRQYGWATPVDGNIVRASICSCAGNQQTPEIKVWLVLNGNDMGNVEIIKPANAWSNHIIFPNPVSIRVGDRINFRGRTSNSSVTHAMVSLLIEIDIPFTQLRNAFPNI